MSSNNQNQRLNGFTPLSYIGANAVQPTNFTMASSAPTVDDAREFNRGDWWLNTSDNSIWYLAVTNGLTATWIQVQGSGTGLLSLTGNSGGLVLPLSGNINVVGDGTTVNITGNPGTSTLTMSAIGGGAALTLTGNSGGAVGETAGNINILGAGTISVAGNPGTSTLTISQSGANATSFLTQAGTAVPVAGVLNIYGSNSISTSGAGSTVTVTAGSNIAQSYITSPATGTATPAAGVITFASGTGTSISAAGSTVTITGTGSGALPNYSNGTFTPSLLLGGSSSGISYFAGNRYGWYVRMGSIVFINIYISPQYSGSTGGLAATISGLPFTVSNAHGSFFMETAGWGENRLNSLGSNQYTWCRFVAGTTTMSIQAQLNNLSSGNAFAITSTLFINTPSVYHSMLIQGLYYV